MTVTIASSIPISLFQPLRALFVDTTQVGGPNWKGPDGRPPLYFVIDTGEYLPPGQTFNRDNSPFCIAAFVGSITVPMALVLLGASFARVSITRPLSRYAFPAMFAVAFAKMFLLPVIGIFMVQEMVHRGFIPKSVGSFGRYGLKAHSFWQRQ
jgi:auxin efflux carrier family protein